LDPRLDALQHDILIAHYSTRVAPGSLRNAAVAAPAPNSASAIGWEMDVIFTPGMFKTGVG
jgi:hypothetical protein